MIETPRWVSTLLRCASCHRGPLDLVTDHWACRACGRHFRNDPLAVLLAEDIASDHGRCSMRPATRPREAPWVGDALVDALPRGSTVLSVGEGYGEIALRIAQQRTDLRVVATDLSPTRLAHARALQERLDVRKVWFAVADVTNLPFVDGVFEAGYARGVLHIVPDPESAVRELRRVLRSRLLVDQLANRPFFAVWFWLLQRYENIRARVQGRAPQRGIWQDVVETLGGRGTYRSLWGYRRWFADARKTRVRANCVFIWETGRHRPVLGWTGYAGGIDVWF